jgi:heptaprenyl diphosphate synthase
MQVEQAQLETKALIQKVLKCTPDPLNGITAPLATSLGKGIRTSLALYCAMDEHGDVPGEIVNCAAAIELIHLATLIHDDIIDDSPMRRGLPSVQNQYGKREAVLCGDYLLGTAMHIISDMQELIAQNTNLLSTVTNAFNLVCLGELKQNRNQYNLDMNLVSYLQIISGKTAALFQLAAFVGSVVARCGRPNLDRYRLFGHYYGMIFQIMDDIKDYEDTAKQLHKPSQQDLQGGVVTLPLIIALLKKPELRLMISQVYSGQDMWDTLQLIRSVGGTDDALIVAQRYEKSARRLLHNFSETNRVALDGMLKDLIPASIKQKVAVSQ